jgi:uncharacterized membrane protein HdeD (DUF308 family)
MTGSDPIDTVPVSDRPRRATPWTGLGIGVGLLSIVIGLLVLFWPGASVVVIAWLFAIQLIVSGILQLVAAFMDESGTGTGAHGLMGVLGALSILVGLLCLRAPLQTAVVLGLLIGATWVIGGVIGIVHAIGAGPGGHRGWRIASGVLSALGGAVVLVYPGLSFVAMTWLFGIVLVLIGVVLLAESFMTRREGSRASAEAGGRHSSAAAPSST